MKSQSNNNSSSSVQAELKFSTALFELVKKPRYIYTEEDLGEGILDVGVSA